MSGASFKKHGRLNKRAYKMRVFSCPYGDGLLSRRAGCSLSKDWAFIDNRKCFVNTVTSLQHFLIPALKSLLRLWLIRHNQKCVRVIFNLFIDKRKLLEVTCKQTASFLSCVLNSFFNEMCLGVLQKCLLTARSSTLTDNFISQCKLNKKRKFSFHIYHFGVNYYSLLFIFSNGEKGR